MFCLISDSANIQLVHSLYVHNIILNGSSESSSYYFYNVVNRKPDVMLLLIVHDIGFH
jgi:hypothetical protein